MTTDRRGFLAAGIAVGLGGCAIAERAPARAQVVVVGGGYGGATAARYLRLFSDHRLDVLMIEPEAAFVSCPMSNRVLLGDRSIADLTMSYDGLERVHGVRRIRDTVERVDTDRRFVVLGSGGQVAYDRLVLSPGVELMNAQVDGLVAALDAGQVLQAWRAGPETSALRAQLAAMPDGGVFAICIPEAPYRCPPGPYERACMVAAYFKQSKPRSKVLILDENPDVVSKAALFRKVWADVYPGMIEYRPRHKVVAVDGRGGIARFEVQDDVRADVLNVLPPMRAGGIAVRTGLATSNGRWCNVDYRTFESTAAKNVHVIGDAIQTAPLMPKSGHMANAHAKVAAAAIVAQLQGWEADPAPLINNVCYSFVDADRAIHVASVHAYLAAERTYRTVPGSGGLSTAPTALEGRYAWNWAQTIWSDCVG